MLKFFLIFFTVINLFATEVITPIPLLPFYDKEKALLGKKLFFDTILSGDNTISCSNCHDLPGSGANASIHSFGVGGKEGFVNSPTVLNSTFNFVQFWDGRAKNLKEQALGPIINPIEMGSKIKDVLLKLDRSAYKKEFKNIYKNGVSKENLLEVIAEFEKALTTPNSKFDQYLRGDSDALNALEKKGYESFKKIGCIRCHNGVNIGSNMYQKIGIMIEYDHSDNLDALNGRFNVSKRQRDKRVFKVPTLRNIALTAPYMHDGSATTLEDVVMDMREHQLGITKKGKDVDEIVAFLKTLTGEMPSILKKSSQ